MYLDYYGFTEKPFTITPNPRFIFFSKIHKEAFALLLYGINNHFGFMELVGEVGTGKTTVLRTLLCQLNEESYRIALIFNPSLSAVDLMRAINHEYGIPGESGNVAELLGELNRFLLRENAAGKTVVLVIDEAQNLAPDVLEQIRLISNLETETDKLIQIVLAGQPELGRLLEKPELRQINQRIALRYHLKPLDREDSRIYMEHRLNVAGGSRKVTFTPSAFTWIYRYSRGTPRLINMLCDRALLIGYTESSREITGRYAALAFKDIMLKPAGRFSPMVLGATAMVLCSVLIGIVLGYPYLAGRKASSATGIARTASSGGDATPLPETPTPSPGPVDPAVVKQALREELSVRSEAKSALQSFNSLAPIWHIPPLKQINESSHVSREIMRQLQKRGMVVTTFRGSLDELIRLDSPAFLVISTKDNRNGCLVALTGVREGNITVSPPLLGRSSFPKGEFLQYWSGSAYIAWKNREAIPLGIGPGTEGSSVKKLQEMLQHAGLTGFSVNGSYDPATLRAVREFQVSRGVKDTGTVGPFTLIHLYRTSAVGGMPRLSESGKAGRL